MYVVQMALSFGTGAPIFVLFPLLIYAPQVWHSLKGRIKLLVQTTKPRAAKPRDAWEDGPALHRGPSAFSDFHGSDAQRECNRSAYWRRRFLFAVLLWMTFVSFIAADFAMQALPIPGMACMLADDNQWLLKADPQFVCFSDEMFRSHLAGAILALVFTVLFPAVLYSKIRRISVLNKWDDAECVFQLGYFYDPYKKNWRYLFLFNHLQLCILVNVLSVVFWVDELAMVIAPIILHILYLAVIIVGRPFESWLDNILEAILITISILGFGFSLLLIQDPENEAIEVRIPPTCIHVYNAHERGAFGGPWLCHSHSNLGPRVGSGHVNEPKYHM